MQIRTIGIDLGKIVFHIAGVNARGEVVVRNKCSRIQLLRFTSNLCEVLIGMEACGESHFLGRAPREQRHDARDECIDRNPTGFYIVAVDLPGARKACLRW